MKLLSAELHSVLPKLYTQDGDPNPMVYAKFFFPAGCWTWFVTEGEPDGDDFRFFGYVVGHADECGYFSLNELMSINFHGLTVERDLNFEPGPLDSVLRSLLINKESRPPPTLKLSKRVKKDRPR
jgi:hypothetical protein